MQIMLTHKKNLLILTTMALFFIGVQLYLSASTSFVSDPLAKAIQIESAKSDDGKWIYPAENIDPEKYFGPTLFVIKDQTGAFKSVFSQTFAIIYASIFQPVPVQYLPYFNILFVVLGILSMYLIAGISIIASSIGVFATVFFSQSLDLSEVPLLFFWISLSYSLWSQGFAERNTNQICLGIFLLLLGCFLRLEILILGSFTFGLSLLALWKERRTKDFFLLFFSFTLPIAIFFLTNQYRDGHIFGIRYLYNFESNGHLTVLKRLENMLHIVFTSFAGGNLKIGFFFYSPFFLYLIFFLLRLKGELKKTNITIAHLILIIFYPIIVGFTAPNDGITVTGRYAMATIFPGIFLISLYWKELKQKKFFWILIVLSLIMSFLMIKISKNSNKMIRKTNQILEPLKADLWIFFDQNISGIAGLHLLKQKSIAVGHLDWRKDLHPLVSRIKQAKLKTVIVFDFAKSSPVKFPRTVQLDSEEFDSLWKQENFHCDLIEQAEYIAFRRCTSN